MHGACGARETWTHAKHAKNVENNFGYGVDVRGGDRDVAMFESYGMAVQIPDGAGFLQGYWVVPGASCQARFDHDRWRRGSHHDCTGFYRTPGQRIAFTNAARFAALAVFDTCERAAKFSGLGKCLGHDGQFVPLGVVARIITSGDATRFTHYAITHVGNRVGYQESVREG